jgi:hypothetical protein
MKLPLRVIPSAARNLLLVRHPKQILRRFAPQNDRIGCATPLLETVEGSAEFPLFLENSAALS